MSSARMPRVIDTSCLSRAATSRSSLVALVCLTGVALFAAQSANAFGLPKTLHVGPYNGVGSSCEFTRIQDAIDAADATAGDTITIDGGLTYSAQHLTIAGKSLTLKGAPCAIPIGGGSAQADARLTLSGNSGADSAVLNISGTSNVTLINLDIVGNTAPGLSGGGIAFLGSGSLTLHNSIVRGNQAANGGGIYFNGTGNTTAELKLLEDTQLQANFATSGDGGGILIKGNALLTIAGPRAEISVNGAFNGNGGGIDVIGPATANISSPDFDGGTSVIHNNYAKYGGGIAIISSNNLIPFAEVHLFTTDVLQPVGIVGNTASHAGGGIYLKPVNDGPAFVYASDYRIENNQAQEGAAIYLDSGSYTALRSSVFLRSEVPAPIDAVACTNSSTCNSINSNIAVDDAANPTSVILIQNGGTFSANRVSMRHNEASHLIRIVGDHVDSSLSNCLMANNGQPDFNPPLRMNELIYASGNDTPLVIESCTFANDLFNLVPMIHTESNLTINDSIIAEPGTKTLDYSGNPNNLSVHYVVSNDVTTLPVGIGIIHGTPTFVDAAAEDYHLRPGQYLGVDLAPIPGGFDYTQGIDLDGKLRTIDLPSIINVYGPRDIGPFELQNLFRECGTPDSLFCDGFDHP